MAIRARIACSLALASTACGSAGSQPRPDDAMIDPYIAIATALAQDSTHGVAAAAEEVKRGAAAHGDKPGIARIIAAADGVTAGDLASARTSFKRLSDGMVEYIRSAPPAQTGRVLVHCPMAFAHKGALWVQNEGKIANPYHGSEMLRCGNKLAWDAALPKTAEL